MISKIEFQEAEREAESLIKRLNIAALPVCPFSIAEKHGITVEPKDSNRPGVSGFLFRLGNDFSIQYATHIKNEGFVRFTVAHELGHYFIPGHPEHLFASGRQLHESYSGFISDDNYEKQADHFAKSLLMPDDLFLTALQQAGEGFPAVENMASKCRTSITATAIRFAQLAEDPVAVIMSSGNKIEWCFMSQALTNIKGLRWLKKGSLIPSGTATARFNENPANVLNGEKAEGWTYLQYWFDEAPEFEMKEDVVGLGSYRRTLTVLFTDEPIETEEDNDYLEIGNVDRGWK